MRNFSELKREKNDDKEEFKAANTLSLLTHMKSR